MPKTNEITRACDPFFRKMDRQGLALSYGDIRMKTAYSEILPSESCLNTQISRNISLKMPIASSPMDTVTESEMAIVMAKLGGIGIIHKAMPPKEQASAVSRVKHHLNGFIPDPICVSTIDTVENVLKLKTEKSYKFFSFMVKDGTGKIVGLVTRNDFDFCSDPKSLISEIMSKDIISAENGTSISEAYQIMLDNRKKILPIFNKGIFKGIYTFSDLKRIVKGDLHEYNFDSNGSLIVGAAIGVGADMEQRLELLNHNKVDLIVIDTAHGNSKAVIETIKYCKSNYPNLDVVAGNISEAEAAKRLVEAEVDGLRIGQGPGSICTTRVIAGIGTPQVSAIYNCAKMIRGSGIPIIADGGIEYSGDITIALGAGADSVMLGNLLAGTKESPGEILIRSGKQVKRYRGMGSIDAMLDNQASRERYGQVGVSNDKLVAEGVSSFLDYKGEVAPIIYQLLGGLRSGMGYTGSKTIKYLQENANFNLITNAGLKESHPHGLDHIDGSSNYQR